MAGVPVGSTAPDHDLDDAEQGDDADDDNDRHSHEEVQWELCQSCQQFLVVIFMIDGDGE